MPLPPGTEQDQEIQRLGAYIENRIAGATGVQAASDYEKFAAGHSKLTASQSFLGWMFSKVGLGLGKSIGLDLGDTAKAANQIAHGTVSGLDKTGQNKIDQALGQIEKGLIGAGKAIASPVTDAEAVGGFLSNLTQRDFWVRVAKVVIGGAMVIVGLAQLSGAGKVLSNVKVLPV